jgi:hypothetical protein
MKTANQNKLAHITDTISASLGDLLVTGNGDYEFSASYGGSKARQLSGLWKVNEHTVGGIPYARKFAEAKFGDAAHSEPVYESTFEFIKNVCIKRVMVYAELDSGEDRRKLHYDYRMSLVFMFELHKETISVLPILGYQSVSIDNETGAVKELAPSNDWLPFVIKFEKDAIILEDGTDIKRLERAAL